MNEYVRVCVRGETTSRRDGRGGQCVVAKQSRSFLFFGVFFQPIFMRRSDEPKTLPARLTKRAGETTCPVGESSALMQLLRAKAREHLFSLSSSISHEAI